MFDPAWVGVCKSRGAPAGVSGRSSAGAATWASWTGSSRKASAAKVFALVPALDTVCRSPVRRTCWLAWQAVRPGGLLVFAPVPTPGYGPGRLFAMGLVTNVLNPKIAVLYVSLLPQFIDPARGGVGLQSLTLSVVRIGG
ncbi:LysE family translocator [Saccharopolyspora spinosa]|nr:hypothetical protein [Saccharopolyspora spinosa]